MKIQFLVVQRMAKMLKSENVSIAMTIVSIIPFSLQLILIFKLILDFWKETHNQGMKFKFNFTTIYLFMQKAKLMTRLAPSNVNYQ